MRQFASVAAQLQPRLQRTMPWRILDQLLRRRTLRSRDSRRIWHGRGRSGERLGPCIAMLFWAPCTSSAGSATWCGHCAWSGDA